MFKISILGRQGGRGRLVRNTIMLEAGKSGRGAGREHGENRGITRQRGKVRWAGRSRPSPLSGRLSLSPLPLTHHCLPPTP